MHGASVGCVHAKALQLCLSLCDPMDCNLLGSSVHEILQARILGWVAMPLQGIFLTRVKPSSLTSPALAGGFFTTSATWEALSGVRSGVQLCSTLCDPMDCNTQPSLSIANSRSLLKLMSIQSVMPSHSLSSPSSTFNLSQHQGLFR